MPLHVIPAARQIAGQFNGGAIRELRPVIPNEGADVRPYSSLFYWAHAWSEQGSTIGEHPHQGFEIMSFVLDGQIDHYDSHYQAWKPLPTGSAQIIRAGSGISHSERLHAGARMFQIWLDPDLSRTFGQPASYDDYAAADFPDESPRPGVQIKHWAGPGAPMRLDTPGIRIQSLMLEAPMELEAAPGETVSAFVVRGRVRAGAEALSEGDFFRWSGPESLLLNPEGSAEVFVIRSPEDPGYLTYAARRRWA